MKSLCHWLTELGEVYARHAARHGPNRLLPAEVLPVHGGEPEPSAPYGSERLSGRDRQERRSDARG
jgi:hypothetical protein